MKKLFTVILVIVLIAGCQSVPDSTNEIPQTKPEIKPSGKIIPSTTETGERKSSEPTRTPTPQEAKVAELVNQLADEDWEKRETATDELVKMGNPIIPILEKMKEHPDPEVRLRIKIVLDRLNELNLMEKYKEKVLKDKLIRVSVAEATIQLEGKVVTEAELEQTLETLIKYAQENKIPEPYFTVVVERERAGIHHDVRDFMQLFRVIKNLGLKVELRIIKPK
jgi:hypothetical protein